MYNNNLKPNYQTPYYNPKHNDLRLKHQNLIVTQITSSFIRPTLAECSQWMLRLASASKSDFHRTHAFLFWTGFAVSCSWHTTKESFVRAFENGTRSRTCPLVPLRAIHFNCTFCRSSVHQLNPSPHGGKNAYLFSGRTCACVE